ncbi:post-segregation antitoxin CcdA protein [Rhizobium gallicum]|uniref:Post-segregation antitoxin CcdA protein n=1 Tax=Rhizobium gallicum TaxID=56730 RepID=A0A1L5NDE7_9HYPH|nr:post-segregation antitoxin CcdA protein [Rhizobium gallicum]
MNLSLDAQIVSSARQRNVNISRAAEDGIARATIAERERLRRLENAEAIAKADACVERHGLPFVKNGKFDGRTSKAHPRATYSFTSPS